MFNRRFFAKGRKPGPRRGQNNLEKEYQTLLEDLQRRGGIIAWGYEEITLKLAPDTRYTPDFHVITNEYELQFREIKAAWKDKATGKYKVHYDEDAKVKIKIAAAKFPQFRFSTHYKDKGDGNAWKFLLIGD